MMKEGNVSGFKTSYMWFEWLPGLLNYQYDFKRLVLGFKIPKII